MTPLLDALGDEIVMGATYGYSSSKGSSIRIVTGKACKMTDKGNVTLHELKSQAFLYGKPYEEYGERAQKVSVCSRILFPVTRSIE
jgi:hypothetical protein